MLTEKQFNALPEKERTNRTLEGIAFYASVHTPNRSAEKKFNAPPAYIIYVGLETKEEIEKAKSYGLKVKDPEGEINLPHVKLQSKIKPKGDKSAEDRFEETKPEVLDSMQNEIPKDILIGNGSRVIVKFMTFWHQMASQHGAGTWINKVQVRELVKFEGGDTLVKDASGYVVDAAPVAKPTAIEGNKKDTAQKETKTFEEQVVLDASIFDE